jgi:hypothetical protein
MLQRIKKFFKKPKRLPEPTTSPPIFIPGMDNKTAVLTMNQNIRAMQTLEISLRSIFNQPEQSKLIHELMHYLIRTENDENYLQISTATLDYLNNAIKTETTDSARQSELLAALNQLHHHFAQTNESHYSYNPSVKRNPQAVFYPNPAYGKSLFSELPFAKKLSLINQQTRVGSAGDDTAKLISQLLHSNQYTAMMPNFSCSLSPSILHQVIKFIFGLSEIMPLLNHEEKVVFSDIPALRAIFSTLEICFLSFTSAESARTSWDTVSQPEQLLSINENISELQSLFNTWRAFNPNVKLILSVSPLPVTTMPNNVNEHIVCASSHIKAILRVAIESFADQHPDAIYYFPAFDTVMYSTQQPLENDIRHLSTESKDKLINLFKIMYLEESENAGTH